jgi:hypothetical protein
MEIIRGTPVERRKTIIMVEEYFKSGGYSQDYIIDWELASQ